MTLLENSSFRTISILLCKISLINISYFLFSEHVVLEKNGLCNEQNIIDDENECRLAAVSTGIENDVILVTLAIYPRGCFVHDSQVWFNRHPIGNRRESCAPICRKGKFMCL